MKTLAWAGVEESLFEVVFVDVGQLGLTARGTQLGATYRLSYELETDSSMITSRFDAECETAEDSTHIALHRGSELSGDTFDVDLQFSPLFNSLPVLRDGLLSGREARGYTMAFVRVPELSVVPSQQEYIPIEPLLVRYRSGTFCVDIVFDAEGFVVDYPRLARRVASA